jgi:sulfur transfer complex TusBCD TusB component (DsrH family)
VFEEVDCVHLIRDGVHVRAVENTIMKSVKDEECIEWMGDH